MQEYENDENGSSEPKMDEPENRENRETVTDDRAMRQGEDEEVRPSERGDQPIQGEMESSEEEDLFAEDHTELMGEESGGVKSVPSSPLSSSPSEV